MSRMLRLLSVCAFVMAGTSALAAPLTVRQKFDMLMADIDKPGITYISEGKEYTGRQTKNYFVGEVRKARPPVKTVEEFIDRIGSKSKNGKPFMVKVNNSKPVESSKFLKMKLAKINKLESASGASPAASSHSAKKEKEAE